MVSETIPEARLASLSYSLPELPSKSSNPDSQSSSEDYGDTSSDSETLSRAYDPQCWPAKSIVFPEVTISAFTETGQVEASIKVPLQRSYTGQDPVIPSSLADTPCVTLGVQGLLDGLNATLRTSYILDNAPLLSILEDCVEKNDDFGAAYGRLRRLWYTSNWNNIRDELRRRQEDDTETRLKALVGNRIVDPNLRPRRLWDLYSNRVVPWWVSDTKLIPRPISHAWVDEQDRVDMWTSINGKEWPVPVPKGASLDLIRIEMLNLGVEYAWLDVLCLRQKGGPKEDLRMEEWKLDVPTIGQVYFGAEVVIYLSGLGLPSNVKEDDLDSERCWFRRAWTLQEVGWYRIIAGNILDGPIHAKPTDHSGNYGTELLTMFHKQLGPDKRSWHLFGRLADMRKRVSTNPVDKIAGLAFPLMPNTIPAYHESQSLEDAWTALVNSMISGMRVSFLLLYPGVGLGCKKWRPTWEQVMTESLPEDTYYIGHVEHDEEADEDSFECLCIKNGHVRGLDVELEGVHRCGELVVESADGMLHTFAIRATHQIPIPKDTYTFLGSRAWLESDQIQRLYWAVGRRLADLRFEKVSVVVMDVHNDIEWLEGLGIAIKSRNVLV
ncbi:hypothetical protein IW262DRAFT_1460707 [Armillaria fumosa]|nr:hypothetical protein IW262DRAFT_1460707 [Armillaria fumosa]